MRLALWVAYDGSEFRGFAPNPGVPSVQQKIEDALTTIFGVVPVLTGAGRTDAGVHGRGQVITFDVPADARPGSADDLRAMERSLNGMCGPAIVVWHVAAVPETFDARFSARARSYRYTVANRRLPDPLRRGRVWHVWDELDRGLMQEAAQCFVGTHDFSSFCRRKFVTTDAGQVEATRVRTVLSARWVDSVERSDEMTFLVTGTSFCQQMVRSLVGVCVDVGRGRTTVAEIAAIFGAQNRRSVGTVAPPDGLVLWEVAYDRTDETAVFLPE